MDGLAGLEGWRWIFIIEGIASVVVGVLTFPLLVDSPALSSTWLTPDEIKYLRLRQEAQRGNSARATAAEQSRKWQIAKTVILDWQIYLQMLIYWSNSAVNYGMKFTMPQIIKNMGFSSSNAQLMTIPPYVMGAVSAFVSSYFADRFRWRMPFIVAAQVTLVISFIVLFTLSDKLDNSRNIGGCYFAVILACIGTYPIAPGGNAWTVENLAGQTKKAQGIALLTAIGNIGGLIGSNIYLDREKPKYPTGFGASFAIAALGIVAALSLDLIFWRINKKRDGMAEYEIRAKYTEEELDKMGDRSPLFRYRL
jgi:sugar phosphate permease